MHETEKDEHGKFAKSQGGRKAASPPPGSKKWDANSRPAEMNGGRSR